MKLPLSFTLPFRRAGLPYTLDGLVRPPVLDQFSGPVTVCPPYVWRSLFDLAICGRWLSYGPDTILLVRAVALLGVAAL